MYVYSTQVLVILLITGSCLLLGVFYVMWTYTSFFQVYATDAIIATLMTCTRSVYPWDVVVIRKGSLLFFDKREKSNFDMLTVNENASEPPQDYFNLSSEATLIDRYFSQQVS